MLARRDRSSVGAARKRWSVTPADPKAPLDWRNVSGRRSRQLLRNVEHTEAVHWFVAVLERQAHSRSREVVQFDPPRRASRYFRHGDRLRSIQPDAFCVLRRGERTWPFFLEWERRAVRPLRWRHASRRTYATTHPIGPPTITACSPPSWSYSRTRSPRHTSCEWRGRRWRELGSLCPYSSPTGACWKGWGRSDGGGGKWTARNPASLLRGAEYSNWNRVWSPFR